MANIFDIFNKHYRNKNIAHKVFEQCGGARGVVVIVVGNEHGDMSSHPGRD